MESRNPASEKRSLFNGSLVKAVVMGGIVVAAGALLFGQREETKTHTIPPIIIRSVDSGDDLFKVAAIDPESIRQVRCADLDLSLPVLAMAGSAVGGEDGLSGFDPGRWPWDAASAIHDVAAQAARPGF